MEWIIASLIIVVLLCFPFKDEEKKLTYNACFGEGDELSSDHTGFAVTGHKALPQKLAYENCFLAGPTGSGKSSIVIYGSIASAARGKHSLVINDVSGELYRTSGYLAKKGYRILRFDPSHAAASESFNPLLRCQSVSDINKLAQIVVQNAMGKTSSDPFWEQSGIMLIAVMCRYLRFHTAEEYCTLQNVLRLIEKFVTDGKSVDRLFVRIRNDEALMDSYKATLVSGEKTLQSIVATARTALQLFVDKEVCKATMRNTIDFSLLRKEPVALFCSTPLKDLKYYKPLCSLFFQSLFDSILSSLPDKKDRPVYFLIDEFASMRFPDIALTVSNIRKYKSGLLLCVQDEMSLVAQYGQAESHQIMTNCATHVYLPGQPLHTCKNLSQVLGRYSLVDEATGKERGSRELLTADEIRQCNDAIILISNKQPLKCATVPHYENFWLRSLTTSKPFSYQQQEVTEPPLLPFQ